MSLATKDSVVICQYNTSLSHMNANLRYGYDLHCQEQSAEFSERTFNAKCNNFLLILYKNKSLSTSDYSIKSN